MSDGEEDVCDYSTDENDAVDAEPFTCDRCCYKTQKKWLMSRHKANHAKDKPFRCPSCRFTHKDSSVFVDHLEKHLPKSKIMQCCFCSFKSMPSIMKSHILQHGPAEKLDCSECEYWTNSIKSMTEHIEAYHTKKHSCHICSKMLTRYALTKHIKKAHKPKKPPSNDSMSTKPGSLLMENIASRPGLTIIPVSRRAKNPHLGKKTPRISSVPGMMPVVHLERCRIPPECWRSLEASRKPLSTRPAIGKSTDRVSEQGEPIETSSEFEDAQETLTDVQTPLEIPKGKQIRKPVYFPALVAEFGDTLMTCSICDYQTRKEHLLKRHSARHDDDLPFACRRCDFENISVYEFANHMITHEGLVKDDVYTCFFCDFWTHKKHFVPIHLDRHRGMTRVFDCPECEEVLTSKGGLLSHFDKLHCKALDCQFCGKNMTKFELNNHIKEHADEIPEPKHRPSEPAVEQTGPSSAEPIESKEIRIKPSNPLGKTKYKPKPLSRKKLDLKSNVGLGSKTPKKLEDETSKPTTASSKYKPRPLSKKEPEKTPSKVLPESPVDRSVILGNVKSTSSAKRKPGPLSKKLPLISDGGVRSAVTTEEVPDAAKKRKRSPTPTKSKADSPKQESSGKDLECRYCDYKTQISSLMDRHREKHKADTPFKCTKCKYETLSSRKLSWHFMYHFPSQTDFPCPYCIFSTKYRSALPTHIERHRLTRFFDCSKCQFSGNNAQGVKTHYKRMHVDKYGCTVCDKVMTKHAMMKHLKKRHPSVYNSPASSTAEVHNYVKHYMQYMRPIGVAADAQKKKRPKPSGESEHDVTASCKSLQKPDISQDDSGIKAAQHALAKEIFGDMSDSDEGTKPSIPTTSKPTLKSLLNSSDSDSDSETVIPKLSCPKCDFTTNQITDVKSHYRDMHEIEYACTVCRKSSTFTQYEFLSHLKECHPSIDPKYYGNVMKCCAPEKPLQEKLLVKMESEDSDDSENEACAQIISDKDVRSNISSCNEASVKVAPGLVISNNESVAHPSASTSEQSGSSHELTLPTEEKLGPEVRVEAVVPVVTDEPTILNEQDSDTAIASMPPLPPKPLDSARIAESADPFVRPMAACPTDKSKLDETAERGVAPRYSSEPTIAPPPEEILGSTATIVKATDTHQGKSVDVELKSVDESSDIRLKCKECSFQTLRMSLLQRHSVKHKAGAPLVCPQCHFQNSSPYEFLLHWTDHFPDQLAFRCCFCAFATVSKLDLAVHFCVHNNTRLFDCNECDYSTSTKAFFEGHIWSIHKKVTCQKCQESMAKTELPSHKCSSARDDDVLNTPDDGHKMASVSRAKEPVPGKNLSSDQVSSAHCNDTTREKVPELSTSKRSIARETFKTSELRKFSFLRKRDDLPSADIVFTSSSPTAEEPEGAVSEEPSPAFESLSAESSFAEPGSGAGGEPMVVDDISVGRKSVLDSEEVVQPTQSRAGVSGHAAEPLAEAERSGPSRGYAGDPTSIESAVERTVEHEKNSVIAVSDSEVLGFRGQPGVMEVAVVNTLFSEVQVSSVDKQLPGDEPTVQRLSQEDSFSADEAFPSSVPIIDISGKPERPDSATDRSGPKPPSTSWTEPIGSDDEVGDGNDHNYSVVPGRSKSPAVDFSPRSEPPRSSPIKSEDFPGDYRTEVVFDNGMVALVFEVSDSSEEEM